MDFLKKFLILLAIFCVIGSMAAISAEEVADDQGYAGSQYQDDIGDDGTPDDTVDDVNQVNENGENAQLTTDSQPQVNETSDGNITANTTTNTTGNITGNNTGNATAGNNSIVGALHNLLSTGNPIFILVILVAVVGGITVFRRK